MTRSTLRRSMRRVYWFLGLIILAAVVAKFAEHVPGLKDTLILGVFKDIYELIRDMALLIATGGVAAITNTYQRRSQFIEALRQEWREIVQAKSAVFTYTQLENPTTEQYLATFCKLSETIDNMRTVYANVGETGDLVGLYPYAPLHDMRRALQTLDPRLGGDLSPAARKKVRDATLQVFYAVRDRFLEELDLEEPDAPVLISGARRLKSSGAAGYAGRMQGREAKGVAKAPGGSAEIDQFLAELKAKEDATSKIWRPAAGNGAVSAPGRAAPPSNSRPAS
ncbi:MAG TPA: hypothetical protein PK264_08055 [Hyphomicrobiaceae bacterium]|nr:hypothetical protein [Hyphomicrobiaceae bacterium]